jgi:alpha-galactosidase
MDTTFISQIKDTLKSDMEFEFSLDFQGQVEYVESENTDQFLEYELVLLFLVEKDLIPINERTEGIVTIESGMVYISYKTCTQVGEDWNDDVWNEGTSEHSVNDLVVE